MIKEASRFFILTLICLIATSCNKKPSASFTTDSDFYYAGQTVQLTNLSQNADSYVWTMPDGSTSTEKEPSYLLDTNIIYQNLTFKLEAFSKNGKKSSQFSKTIIASLKPKLEKHTFTNGSSVYIVTNGTEIGTPDDKWGVMKVSNTWGPTNTGILEMYFPGDYDDKKPGVYELNSDINMVLSGYAYIQIRKSCFDCGTPNPYDHTYTIYSGKVVLNVIGSKWSVVFNNAAAKLDTTQTTVYVSGHISTL